MRITNKKSGFTLIELLVAISIIGVLTSLIVNNLNSSRARARDTRKKQNMQQIKTALRLYYNDYQAHPASFSSAPSYINYIQGCGADGTDQCPCDSSVDFAAGGTGCDTVYMASLPADLAENDINYYYVDADTYCLSADMENTSDPDILPSQSTCSNACSGLYTPGAAKYLTCAE